MKISDERSFWEFLICCYVFLLTCVNYLGWLKYIKIYMKKIIYNLKLKIKLLHFFSHYVERKLKD